MAGSTVEIVIVARDGATSTINNVSRSLQDVSKHTHAASTSMGGFGGQLNKVASLAEGVLIGMLAFQAVRLPGQIISTAVEAYAAYERLGLTLQNLLSVELRQKETSLSMTEAMGRVKEQSKDLINWTQKLAILSPFTQETVTYTLQTAMGYGMASDMAQQLTQMLADFAAGTGKSEEQTRLLGLALGQVWAKGKLTGEEMRQLTNAGMGVEMVAKAAGLSMEQFADVMKEGEIDARTLIPRLIELSNARFAGAAEAQATSWAGLLSTLQDITKIGLRTFFEDTFKAIQPAFAGLVADWDTWLIKIASAGEVMARFVGNAVLAIGRLRDSFATMSTNAQTDLKIIIVLLAGGPLIGAIGIAYRAIVALGTAFVTMRMRALAEIVLIWRAAYELSNLFKSIANFLATGKWAIPDFESFEDQVGRVTGDLLEMTGGVETLEKAMEALGGSGLPGIEGLKQTWTDLWQEIDIATIATAQIGGEAEKTYPSIATLGNKAQETAGKLRNLIASSSELVSYLISIDPAAMAAASAVSVLTLRITGLKDQQEALQASIQAAQNALQGMQDRVSSLSDALSVARQRLSSLSAPRLLGMQQMDEQMSAVERQLNRLKLVNLGLPSLDQIKEQFKDLMRVTREGGVTMTQFGLSDEEAQAKLAEMRKKAMEEIKKQFPEMTAETQAYLDTLPDTAEGLEQVMEKLRLTKALKFDEQLQRIADAARGAVQEFSFEEAIAQIQATHIEIGTLESQLIGAKAAAAAQEAAIRGMQDAAAELTRAIQQLEKDLTIQKDRQKLVNDALEIAYKWFMDDRQKMIEMGGEAVDQAGIIDDATRELLRLTTEYAGSQASAAITAIQAALDQYRLARVEMAAGLGAGSPQQRALHAQWRQERMANGENPNDWNAFRAFMLAIGQPDPGPIPYLAKGVRSFMGGLAMVGERGPELVSLPRGSQVYSAGETRQMLKGGNNYYYNLTVNSNADKSTVIRDFTLLKALAGGW